MAARKWTDHEVRRLRRFADQGKTVDHVAKMLGRSIASVVGKAKSERIKLQPLKTFSITTEVWGEGPHTLRYAIYKKASTGAAQQLKDNRRSS